MNLSKEIQHIRIGQRTFLSAPTEEDLDKLPKNDKGDPDISKLPPDNIRNVILVCLANYPVKDKKEAFYINTLASLIAEADETIELKEKFKTFLIKVLNEQLYRKVVKDNGQEEYQGLYYGWVVSQVLSELGVKSDITEDDL